MSNTKAELVEAALAQGLGSEEELNALTKQEILDLMVSGGS